MANKLSDLAKAIDHSLLHPTLTDRELREGCEFARDNRLAAVSIKPYAVAMAAGILAGSGVAPGAVVGFPHGNSRISVKVHEATVAIDDGATELDAVVNIGKVLGGDWEYVADEIGALNEAAAANGALLKLIFENDYLTRDSFKIRLCEICSRVGAAFVKTSTGYGFARQPDGSYSYRGATEHDLKLMRKHSAPGVRLKAAGGVRTLDQLLKVLELGVTRVGLSATKAILDEARERGWG
ncbi:MAG: deoxyribose-phosphate aldolase [Candidatus Glassbacteria bacterium]|nr:deoxyribose-phosphate aldolase [Candidatus Glassbacteria bacterium]